MNGQTVIAGNPELLAERGVDSQALQTQAEGYLDQGCTLIYIAVDGHPAGFLALSDTVRPDAADTIRQVRAAGVTPVLLTGDHENAAWHIARQLGIAELLQKFPYELSGGQKQRVAVARALITQPKLVLADEPTGALDSRATDELLRLFEDVNRGGQTILMVTHSVKAASHASRVLCIKDGEVFHEIYRGESSDEQLYQKISDTLTMLATGGEHHA